MDIAYETDIEQRFASIEAKLENLIKKEAKQENKMIIHVVNNDMDKVLAALLISASAAVLGIKIQLFFALWGIDAVRKTKTLAKKKVTEKMMAMMSPSSYKSLPLSKFNMLGMGPLMMKYMMKDNNIPSQEELMDICRENGVEFTACEMTMRMMGITKSELMDDVVVSSLTKVLTDTTHSKFTFMI